MCVIAQIIRELYCTLTPSLENTSLGIVMLRIFDIVEAIFVSGVIPDKPGASFLFVARRIPITRIL